MARTRTKPANLRVLGRLRLSRSTEESTSIERQREVIEQWAAANDHTVIGFAEDIDVSGSIDPFETKNLGDWLNNRAPDFDVVACWRLDTLSRSAIHLNKVFAWCLEHDKTVVSCSESIDLSTPAGRLIANVIGFLAEGELEALRERQRSSRSKLRQSARWPGGKPAYGYKAVRHADPSQGWTLVVDPLASQVVRRIVDDVIDGKQLTRIARELTSEGYRTPAAYYAALRAGQPALRWAPNEEPTGKWNTTPLRNMLRSRALRGYAHHNGETVRDDNGMPIQLAEPLVTLDEWELIQATLDRVQESRRGILRNEASLLAGVVFCYECGEPLHHDRNSVKRDGRHYVYRYYRCKSREHTIIPAEELEELAEETFLDELGDVEVRERVWVPGDSREAELREAVTALDELTSAAGRAQSATAKQRLHKQLDALDARIVELESAPAKEARWEYLPTGETYRSVWERSTSDERRELLLRSGITITASIRGVEGKRSRYNGGAWHFEIRVPAEISVRSTERVRLRN